MAQLRWGMRDQPVELRWGMRDVTEMNRELNRWRSRHDEKTQTIDENTIEWLLTCVEENPLFYQLTIKQRKNVLTRMKLITVKCGQFVINQGDEGEKAATFYVVESGEYDVLVDGVKVHHYSRGGSFGELALLNNAPRAASIVCVSNNITSKLYEISRQHIHNYIAFLKTVDLFKPLLRQELTYLNDALEEISYINKKNKKIYRQWEDRYGGKFFIIKKGKVFWKREHRVSHNTYTKYLNAGQFFGEPDWRSTRIADVRAATVSIATNDETILLSLTRHEFEQLIAPVIIFDIIDDQIVGFERNTELTKNDAQSKSKKLHDKEEKNKYYHNVCPLGELRTIGVLGKGNFALVSLVVDGRTGKSYALKAVAKSVVISQFPLQKYIISEKMVMDELSNKFLVSLYKTYKDKLRVYFLLEPMLGGDLFTVLHSGDFTFEEPPVRFYAASVCEALDYMHSYDIIHRSIMPENLLLDGRGYLKVADFSYAKKITDKTYTICGAHDYLCPEMVTGQWYGKGCDWWTLGVLIYEMLASFPPFVADEPIVTCRKIIRGRIRFPRYFSQEVRDLIRGLLHNKSSKRLGVLKGGANNIRKHIWFKGFEWNKLNNQSMKAPPLINKLRSTTDLSNYDDEAQPIGPKDEFDYMF